MREEELEKAILERNRSLDKAALDKMVEEKLRSSPFLTRRGALLIILEEMRIAQELISGKDFGEYLQLKNITPGLQNINVVGRVVGKRAGVSQDGRAYIVLKLSDGTGSVEVLGDDADVLREMRVGDVLAAHGCTVVRRNNRITIRLSPNTVIKKDSPEVPPLENLLKPLSEAAEDESSDIWGVVVYDTGAREAGDGILLNDVIVTDGKNIYLLHAYREHASFFIRARGKKFVAANLKHRGKEFFTSYDTCIEYVGEDISLVKNVLEKAGNAKARPVARCFDEVTVLWDGKKLYRAPQLENAFGNVLCRNIFVLDLNNVPHIYCEDYEHVEESCEFGELPLFRGELESFDGRLVDVCLQAEFLRKTQLSMVETRFGARQLIRFWLRVGDTIYSGAAWGPIAEKVNNLTEGEPVTIVFPLIKKNQFGESEVQFDRFTAVLLKEKQVK
ncbi:MAG: OB-fold nucleic acid binding domain-containing protein [Candidatus Caldarchaeum sp.]